MTLANPCMTPSTLTRVDRGVARGGEGSDDLVIG